MTSYQVLTLVISGAAIVLSAVATGFSIYNFIKQRQLTVYSDLDHLYFDLLKSAIDHPNFVNPAYTRDYKNKFSDNELFQYELYAFMAWNICETIADRRKYQNFFESWEPVLIHENELHRKWFDDPENHNKFKKGFRKYIQSGILEEDSLH